MTNPQREQQRHDLVAAIASELRRAGCANDVAEALALALVRIVEGHGWRPTAIDRPPEDPLHHGSGTPAPPEFEAARAAMRRHDTPEGDR